MTTKKGKTEEMSIDKLAVMVANGFQAIDKRFDEVDKRFVEIDNRFDEVDKRFDKVEQSIIDLDSKVEVMNVRLKKVESAIEPILMGYTIIKQEVGDLNLRLTKLEKHISKHS